MKRALPDSGEAAPAAKAAKTGPVSSAASPGSSSSSAAASSAKKSLGGRQPEFELPVASILRLIKRRIPDNISVGKSAKQAFVKAAGIFVLYLTYCSTDYCRQHHRSTISARDVIDALHELEFEDYVDDLQECLVEFRKSQQGKKDEKKKRDAKRESEKRAAAASAPAAHVAPAAAAEAESTSK